MTPPLAAPATATASGQPTTTAVQADALAAAQGAVLSPSFQFSARGALAPSKCTWDLAVLSASDADARAAAAWILG